MTVHAPGSESHAWTSRRWPRVLLIGLLAVAVWLLHVPRERVVLMHDALGYAAQASGVLNGHGNVVLLDDQALPGIYPVGLPLLLSVAMALLGDDLRHGQWSMLVCTLLLLLVVYRLGSRLHGDWVGLASVAILLASPAFRYVATQMASQVPTAAVIVVSVLLLAEPHPGTRRPLLAGLLASLSLLLRFANVSFPLALGLGAFWLALRGGASQRRTVVALAAGGALGLAVVLLHNALVYGHPLTTGYALWGLDMQGHFSLRNILTPVLMGNREDDSQILRSLAGLAGLQQLPVVLASLWGLVVLWRQAPAGSFAQRFAVFAPCVVAAQALFLACYAFRSESYLVPAQPLAVVLAAVGGADIARRLLSLAGPDAARRAGAVTAGAAMLLLAFSLRPASTPHFAAELETIVRHDSLARAGRELEPNAALVTPSDFALVEALVRTPGRRILYLGPFVAPLLERAAMRETGRERFGPFVVVPWIGERAREGRPIYFDQNPPVRGLTNLHKDVRNRLLAEFRLVPTEIPNIFRIRPLGH